jgi:hypothetical protein
MSLVVLVLKRLPHMAPENVAFCDAASINDMDALVFWSNATPIIETPVPSSTAALPVQVAKSYTEPISLNFP